MTLGYALPIDIKMEGEVKIEQVIAKRKPKLLVMTVSLLVFTVHQEILGKNTVTFPASLAIYARIAFGPSCVTLCVSSSESLHMIAKSRGGRLKGMEYHV